MNQEQLKNIIKMAVAEVLEERQDLLHEAVAAALEDIALSRAIKEGEKTSLVGDNNIDSSRYIDYVNDKI